VSAVPGHKIGKELIRRLIVSGRSTCWIKEQQPFLKNDSGSVPEETIDSIYGHVPSIYLKVSLDIIKYSYLGGSTPITLSTNNCKIHNFPSNRVDEFWSHHKVLYTYNTHNYVYFHLPISDLQYLLYLICGFCVCQNHHSKWIVLHNSTMNI